MNTSEEPVHLAGATLGEHRHICAFFHNVDEEYRVLVQVNPFFAPPDQFLRALRKRRSAGPEPASLG
jgi:hypothetical protein